MQLGAVTVAQMAQAERQMDEVGLDPLQILENASFAVAEQARRMLGSVLGRPVVVLVGPGQTGAVGAAVARRLASWGAEPTILLGTDRAQLQSLALRSLEVAEQFDVRVFEPGALMPPAELIVDGLVGTGLAGPLRETIGELVASAMKVKVPVLAIDVPSGLDPDSGRADQPAIRADVTVTLGYPKVGLVKPFATQLVGLLFVADLGIPARTWSQFGQPPPDFSQGPLVAYGD